MIHQGHAVVESQGVLIAECGPGEFLGEAGGWGSAEGKETHFFLGGGIKEAANRNGKLEGNFPENNALFGVVSYNDPLFFSGISEYLT